MTKGCWGTYSGVLMSVTLIGIPAVPSSVVICHWYHEQLSIEQEIFNSSNTLSTFFFILRVQSNAFGNYTSTTNGSNSEPSGPNEWEIEPPPIEDAGIPVKALYDFQGIEDDELNFKEGDVLTQLSSQDDQGWCQGRFKGKVGHFPGSYVEPLWWRDVVL